MKIINGHDYYDSALSYGQDTDVVFVRTPVTYTSKECPLYRGFGHTILKGRSMWSEPEFKIKINGVTTLVEFVPVVVYIGAKRYGGIKVVAAELQQTLEVFWNYENYKLFIEANGHKLASKEKNKYYWYKPEVEQEVFDTLEKFFCHSEATTDQLNWLVSNRVAIAVWQGSCRDRKSDTGQVWECNVSNLKDLMFYRAIDSFALFQELSMFVGGVIPRNPNPMVEITDNKIKVAKHGFDKWSFRKHKEDN
jgi:hypothetical protein